MTSCLLFLSALSTEAPFAQDAGVTDEYRIFPCETMANVNLIGLPEISGVRLKASMESCATGIDFRIDPEVLNDEAETLWETNQERMPRISITKKDNHFDVRVRWNDTNVPITYTATRIAASTPPTSLTPDTAGGPQLRVSIEPAENQTNIGIAVVDANPKRIIDDLEHFKNLTFRNKSLLAGAPISFRFDVIPTATVIELLAFESGIAVRREGESSYVFGKPANAAKIKQLRDELAALPDLEDKDSQIKLLQDIVDLASTDKPDELPSDVGLEIAELSELYLDREEFALAKELIQLKIDQKYFLNGKVGSTDHALALITLGQIQRLQNDLDGATQTLEKASAMLDEHPDAWSLPARARVIREQAYVALNSGNLAEASTIIQRANAVLDDKRVPEWNSHEVYEARKSVESLSGWIATKHLENENLAEAQVHIENALRLNEAMYGTDQAFIDEIRYLAGMNLTRLGEYDRASEYQKAQIAISLSRSDPLSAAYVRSVIFLCSNLVKQEKFKLAQKFWGEHVALIRSTAGASSTHYVSALRGMALLYRLGMDARSATEIERKIASVQVGPDDFKAGFSPPVGLEHYLTSIALPSTLVAHYPHTVEGVGESKDMDVKAMLRANWRGAEVMAAIGQDASAIIALHQVALLARKVLPPESADAQRYSDRLKELCSIHKLEAGAAKFPDYACPG